MTYRLLNVVEEESWVCPPFIPVSPTVFSLCRHPEDEFCRMKKVNSASLCTALRHMAFQFRSSVIFLSEHSELTFSMQKNSILQA